MEKKKKAASCKKQPFPTQKSIKPEKVEVVAIKAEDNPFFTGVLVKVDLKGRMTSLDFYY